MESHVNLDPEITCHIFFPMKQLDFEFKSKPDKRSSACEIRLSASICIYRAGRVYKWIKHYARLCVFGKVFCLKKKDVMCLSFAVTEKEVIYLSVPCSGWILQELVSFFPIVGFHFLFTFLLSRVNIPAKYRPGEQVFFFTTKISSQRKGNLKISEQ